MRKSVRCYVTGQRIEHNYMHYIFVSRHMITNCPVNVVSCFVYEISAGVPCSATAGTEIHTCESEVRECCETTPSEIDVLLKLQNPFTHLAGLTEACTGPAPALLPSAPAVWLPWGCSVTSSSAPLLRGWHGVKTPGVPVNSLVVTTLTLVAWVWGFCAPADLPGEWRAATVRGAALCRSHKYLSARRQRERAAGCGWCTTLPRVGTAGQQSQLLCKAGRGMRSPVSASLEKAPWDWK